MEEEDTQYKSHCHEERSFSKSKSPSEAVVGVESTYVGDIAGFQAGAIAMEEGCCSSQTDLLVSSLKLAIVEAMKEYVEDTLNQISKEQHQIIMRLETAIQMISSRSRFQSLDASTTGVVVASPSDSSNAPAMKWVTQRHPCVRKGTGHSAKVAVADIVDNYYLGKAIGEKDGEDDSASHHIPTMSRATSSRSFNPFKASKSKPESGIESSPSTGHKGSIRSTQSSGINLPLDLDQSDSPPHKHKIQEQTANHPTRTDPTPHANGNFNGVLPRCVTVCSEPMAPMSPHERRLSRQSLFDLDKYNVNALANKLATGSKTMSSIYYPSFQDVNSASFSICEETKSHEERDHEHVRGSYHRASSLSADHCDSLDARPPTDFVMSGPSTEVARFRPSMNPLGRANSMAALRVQREAELISRDGKEAPWGTVISAATIPSNMVHKVESFVPYIVLHVSGILPFESPFLSRCYTALVSIVMLLMLVFSFILARGDTDNYTSVHYVTMCLSAGTLFGFCSLRYCGITAFLGSHAKTLERYALQYDFFIDWSHDSTRRIAPIAALWFFAVVARSIAAFQCSSDLRALDIWLPWCLYVAVSGSFAAQAFCQVHIATGLQLMVEGWCMRFFNERNVETGVKEWNIVQAVLRQSASKIEACMFLLGTSSLAALVMIGLETFDSAGGMFEDSGACIVSWGFTSFAPLGMSIYAIYHAGQVTGRCIRVPSLLNSIAVDFIADGLDADGFRVVDYITNSAAGFYVKEVRVTTFMVLKFAYVVGAIVLTLTANMVRN